MVLRLQIRRDTDNRLNGTISTSDDAEVRSFSGTLELLRLFEELVPLEPAADEGEPSRSPA